MNTEDKPINISTFGKRNPTVDTLKGMAIFLVVWGHCIQFFGEGIGMLNTVPGKCIYLFHMPLFFFMSGFLSLGAMKTSFIKLLSKKSCQLLLPLVAWATLDTIIKSSIDGIYNPTSLLKMECGAIIYGFWFIPTLFAMFCILWLLTRVKNQRVQLYIIIISFFIIFIIPKEIIPIGGYLVKIKAFFPFFALGYLFNVLKTESIMISNKNKSLIFATLGGGIAYYLCKGPESFVYSQTFDIWHNPFIDELGKWLLIIVGGLAGIVLFWIIADFALRHFKMSAVKEIGKYTLGIYMVQTIAFSLAMRMDFNWKSHVYYFLTALVLTGFYFGICKLMDSSKITRSLFLGKFNIKIWK